MTQYNVFPWRQVAWRRHRVRCLLAVILPIVTISIGVAVFITIDITAKTDQAQQQVLHLKQQSQQLQSHNVVAQQHWHSLQCDQNHLQQIVRWWQQVARTMPSSLQLMLWQANQQTLQFSVQYHSVMALQQWTRMLQETAGVSAVHWHEMKQQQAAQLAMVVVELKMEQCDEAA